MKNILVLGGTRFFGKRLVELLLEEGHSVTIATRGNVGDSFGDKVTRMKVDREDATALKTAVEGKEWDIVYDNICYSPNEAQAACNIFNGRVKKYILTSTLSVYGAGEDLNEADFDPYTYGILLGTKEDFPYGEGKRLTEAVFFQKASFPTVAVRFPIVLGTDDYTRRLHFHIDHVKNGEPIGFPNLEARMSFILSSDAAKFLKWVGFNELSGPINAAAKGSYQMSEVIELIEDVVGKKAIIQANGADEHHSPFGIASSWYMDITKADEAGYPVSHLSDWFPSLVQQLAK